MPRSRLTAWPPVDDLPLSERMARPCHDSAPATTMSPSRDTMLSCPTFGNVSATRSRKPPWPRPHATNRTQRLVIGFFVLAWFALVVILRMSPAVREVTVRRVPGTGTPAVVTFAVLLLGFLTVLAIGVLRRWRRLYWLLLLAFAGGLARVPIAVLQLLGGWRPEDPTGTSSCRASSVVIQLGIAVAMFVGYRRSGPWAALSEWHRHAAVQAPADRPGFSDLRLRDLAASS
jgi:hypothetical protein